MAAGLAYLAAMSSRRPRSSFAAPLVVTLALAPACVIRTAPVGQPRTGTTTIANPPRPATGTTTPAPPPKPQPPDRPPPRQTDPSTDVVQAAPNPTQTALTSWTVYKRADASCYAMQAMQCPPAPATCNPPPPLKMSSCPAGASEKKSVNVKELAPGECYVVASGPASCPAGATCNPPRPVKIDCPSY